MAALIRNFSDAYKVMDKPGLKVDLQKPVLETVLRWREGSKERPEAVIRYFEGWGAKNVQNLKGDDVDAIYFIGRSGYIEKTNNEDLKWIIRQCGRQ